MLVTSSCTVLPSRSTVSRSVEPAGCAVISELRPDCPVTGLPSTAWMMSPALSTLLAGYPGHRLRDLDLRLTYGMCKAVRAAAVAVSCDEAICSVSCCCVCCALSPGGNSSLSGTTASDGFSHARSAWKMFRFVPGPPW